MTARQAAIAVAVLLLAVLAAVMMRRSAPTGEPAPRADRDDPAVVAAEGDAAAVKLFFPGGGWLVVEERSIGSAGARPDPQAIATEVLAGPTTPGLRAPFPAGTQVGSVFVSASGVAYVDLISTEPSPPSSGSRDEMLSVYSVVNSVHANLPDLSGVVLLWNGQQRPTFAGHLDTGRPLTQNRSLVARR